MIGVRAPCFPQLSTSPCERTDPSGSLPLKGAITKAKAIKAFSLQPQNEVRSNQLDVMSGLRASFTNLEIKPGAERELQNRDKCEHSK